MVDAIVTSGGRVGLDPIYYNQAVKALARDITAFKDAGALKRAGLGGKLVLDLAGSVLELLNKPVMEWLVPTMKLGLFDTLASHEMGRAEKRGLTQEQLTDRLISAWDSVDNRLGQLAYDNLFWNRALKDSLMLATRSVGWNLGTWREYGGAILDAATLPARLPVVQAAKNRREGKRAEKQGLPPPKPEAATDEWLTLKMGYVMGAVATSVMIGSILYYLYNKKRPWEDPEFEGFKDLIFVPTGGTRPDGSRDRITLPTYMKDLYAYGKAPGKTISHKLHPLWGAAADIMNNEDFYGTQIRSEGADFGQQLLEAAGYGAKQFVPFSVRNYMQQREAGADPARAAQTFMGIIPAPASVARSKTLQDILNLTAAKIPQGSRTKEDTARSKRRRELVRAIRMKTPYQITGKDLSDLGISGLKGVYKEASMTYTQAAFSRLSMDEQARIFEKAPPKIQEELRGLLIKRVANQSGTRLMQGPERNREAFLNAARMAAQPELKPAEEKQNALETFLDQKFGR